MILFAAANLAAPALEWAAPFILLLLTIAVLGAWPNQKLQHWWEAWWNKLLVSVPFIAVVLYWSATNAGGGEALKHEVKAWFSFVSLIIPMMLVTYGVVANFRNKPTPLTNTCGLALGCILGVLIGTPGAALVTTIALLKINKQRAYTTHIWIFTIMVVSNIGGMLLPSGPPLAIALQGENGKPGIGFGWFATSLLLPWTMTLVWSLLVFYFFDRHFYKKEASTLRQSADLSPPEPKQPLLKGWLNVFLLGVMTLLNMLQLPFWWLEGGLITCAILSLIIPGSRERRTANAFSWNPALEVAVTFLGIFICLAPLMKILDVRGGEIPVTTPMHFFCVTGALSGFLDNAPTLKCMLAVGCGVAQQPHPQGLAANGSAIAVACCLGAAFWGMLSYIGNGPNLVVKSVVENATDANNQRRTMPNFGVYLLYGAGGIVVLGAPLFVYVWLLS